jgi:O-antigen/teichoic acid export membrane protein
MPRNPPVAESLAKHSLLNFGSQIAGSAAALIASILVARGLGPDGAGIYNYLLWLLSLITTVSTLGLPNALTRYIAQYRETGRTQLARLVAGRVLRLGITVAFAAALIVSIAAVTHLQPLRVPDLYLLLVAAAIPWNVAVALLLGIFTGLQRFKTVLGLNLLVGPLSLGLILLSLWRDGGLAGLLWASLATNVLAAVVSGWILRGEIALSGRLPADVGREIRSYVITLLGILFLDLVVWQKSEVFFLGWLSTPDQIAYYSIAYSLVSRVMVLLPGAISGVLLPRIAALHEGGAVYDVGRTYSKSTRYLAFLTLPIIAAGIALARPFVTILYGLEYGGMVPVFRVLLLTGGLAAIVAAGSSVLYGVGHQRIILRFGLIIALINVTLDILLIPRLGAIGAALANGTAQGIGVIAGTAYLVRRLKSPLPARSLLKTAAASIMAALVSVVLINRVTLSPIATLLVGGTIFVSFYLGALVATRNYDQEDIALGRRLVQALRRYARG